MRVCVYDRARACGNIIQLVKHRFDINESTGLHQDASSLTARLRASNWSRLPEYVNE